MIGNANKKDELYVGIVDDVLSRLIVRAEERGLFEGFLVGKNRTRVSHLPFANDIFCFSSKFNGQK